MKLVLMSCCAPCSAGAIKELADGEIPGVDDFIVLFFNPNIFPAAEYDKRLAEQIKYCDALGVKYAIGEYDHAAWRDAIRGMEDAPERAEWKMPQNAARGAVHVLNSDLNMRAGGRQNTDMTLYRQSLVYRAIKTSTR